MWFVAKLVTSKNEKKADKFSCQQADLRTKTKPKKYRKVRSLTFFVVIFKERKNKVKKNKSWKEKKADWRHNRTVSSVWVRLLGDISFEFILTATKK